MDSSQLKDEFIAQETKKRHELLRLAKGSWRSFGMMEILGYGSFVYCFFQAERSNDVGVMFAAIYIFLVVSFNSIDRRIKALLELLDVNQVLNSKRA